MTPSLLSIRGVTKKYPLVTANDQVSLEVKKGEIHAVLGENGAGKSTLMKIIYGAVKPDAGEVLFKGQTVQIKNPQEARRLGISMVFQHFSLFETLSVAENVWLGLGKELKLTEVETKIQLIAKEYGLDVDPKSPVHALSVGERQRVEIIRALLGDPELLILDEPTSVLTPQAVDKLFVVLRRLASRGCSILYISHKLHEIRTLCDVCTVMRAGRVTGQCAPSAESNESLSRMMIGAEPADLVHEVHQTGETVLRVNRLSLEKSDQYGVNLENIEIDLKKGEILGIAGVSGNGQRELLFALSGEDVRARPDSIVLKGQSVAHLGPTQRRTLGLHFVPEERLGRGAVPSLSLMHNLLLTRGESVGAWGWIDERPLVAQTNKIIDAFNVKASGPHALASSLSGGNLQKFIVGREIDAQPDVLIICQPTWGVDVGAAAQIRSEILRLRNADCAVLVVSEELDELFEISDRIQVISQGQLSPSVDRLDASKELIGSWMSGLWQKQPQPLEQKAEAGKALNTALAHTEKNQ
jgi:simple sugar transport system ATP-binding protein